jgi:hypothetical protein
MAKDDGESRRQRLREMREQRHRQDGGATPGADGDDRIARALAERRRTPQDAGSPVGDRPLDRFPRLRDALARRREGQGGGDQPKPLSAPRQGGAQSDEKRGGRVMFARRLRDVPAPEGGEDQSFKLERLERRMEQLRAELARSAEDLRRLKEPQERQPGETAPSAQAPSLLPDAQPGTPEPESISSWLKEDGQPSGPGDEPLGKTKR